MSANLEQHADRLLVLRVGGELKKSELDTVQSEFVQKSPVPERSSFSCCWKTLPVRNAASGGAIRISSSATATTLRKLQSSAIYAGKRRCWRSRARVFAKDQ
jgi:hypothetical protein